jgi:hypothetical protein
MPAKSSAPLRYAVNRLNWQRTHSGFVRLPGEFRVASFATQEHAESSVRSAKKLTGGSSTRSLVALPPSSTRACPRASCATGSRSTASPRRLPTFRPAAVTGPGGGTG